MFYIGTDIGGTFTDTVLVDGDGRIRMYKTPTTPGDLADGILAGLTLAAEDFEISVEELLTQTKHFAHGTTIATNAFIERKGSRTGLITTKGFGDTIFIQRMMSFAAGLAENEIPQYSKRAYPQPLVPRELVKEVTERVDYDGKVVVRLDEQSVRTAVRELVDAEVEAIAVCLLWSFRNPAHEQAIKSIVEQEAPGVLVSISHEIAPMIKEYERTATTTINAYLAKCVSQYVEVLDDRLKANSLQGNLLLMNSIGGVLSAREASDRAVTMLASGPTGGVIGALHHANINDHANVITTDMGGTSFDVGMIVDGRPVISTTSLVEKYHILTPMIDIHAIGAGGGSIAHVQDGYLHVGPDSAGANPGPVCYGKGGSQPTVTDADVVLGIIDPDYFLGGKIPLYKDKAEAVIREQIAEPLGMSVAEAAAAIRTVVDAKMADLLRNLTLEKGYDPRDFVLYAYGGAGPSHSSGFGSELGVKAIVVPATATVHSAFGAVTSDIHISHTFSDLLRTPPVAENASQYLDPARISDNFAQLEEDAKGSLQKNGVADADMSFARFVDMQYRRQTHQITIPIPNGPFTQASADKLVEDFERKYEELYGEGAAFREAGIELTSFRVNGAGKIAKPALHEYALGDADVSAAVMGQRDVYFRTTGEYVPTQVYKGDQLHAGGKVAGPAILEYPGTTVVIDPGQHGTVDNQLNLIIEMPQEMVVESTSLSAGETEIDPITFEVIRHRLQSITDEQAITLKSVSGSPIVTEATDFCCGLYMPDGSIATMGRQVLFHAGTTSQVIKSVIAKCSKDPGINDGDMFIVNNPYDGAVHPPDFSIVCPIFHEGALVAWTGCAAHQLDVGGMVFGSWCSKATEVQQEAMIIPPLRFVEDDKIRSDIWNMLMSMSRLPFMVGLDFKAMIAANHVSRRRFGEMVTRYGLETVSGVMNGLIELSEKRFRQRLTELPDGTFRAVDFIDHDGHNNEIYKVDLAITKKGGTITYDFSETSPQAPGFINCTRSGLIGGLFAGTLPMLAYDLPQNEGILNAIDIIAPEGILNNAKWPAPVSSGTCASVWVTKNVTTNALARLIGAGDKHTSELAAVSDGSFAVVNLAGLNQYGEPFGTMILDPLIGGGGAYPYKDGLDGSGAYEIPIPSIANVETNENFSPMLYLYRRFVTDTGGPGKFRGGLAGGLAFTLHGTDALHAFLTTHGVESPNSAGVFGGLPGSCNVNLHITNTDLLERLGQGELPATSDDFNGDSHNIGAKPGEFELNAGDIFEYTWQGGGGFGDPLQRDPELVRADVVNGAITHACSETIYGVVLNGESHDIDVEATNALRGKLNEAQLQSAERPPSKEKVNGSATKLLSLSENLEVVASDGRNVVRCRCGCDLGDVQENWKHQAAILPVPAEAAGPRRLLHKDLEMVKLLCPECGTLLSTDVKLKAESLLFDQKIEATSPSVKLGAAALATALLIK